MRVTIEDALHRIEDRAALLVWVANAAAETGTIADDRVFSGIADAVEDIRVLTGIVRDALGVDALGIEINQTRG